MEYKVAVKKRFKYMKVFNVSKRINDNSNALSRAMQAFVEKYVLKKSEE